MEMGAEWCRAPWKWCSECGKGAVAPGGPAAAELSETADPPARDELQAEPTIHPKVSAHTQGARPRGASSRGPGRRRHTTPLGRMIDARKTRRRSAQATLGRAGS